MITLTDTAATKVKQLIEAEDEDGLALRVAVRPGGGCCAGFAYEMFFDTDVSSGDVTSTFGDVNVVADASSAQLLQGATLDYHDGLEQSGFAITNPNAGGGGGGCGRSH